MKYFYLLTLLITFNSCATLPSNEIPKNFSSNETEGLIIGSLAIENEKPIFNGYYLHYLGDGMKKISVENMIHFSPAQFSKMEFKPDFFDDNKAVYYFALKKPAGKYSFTTLRLFRNGPSQAWQSTQSLTFNFPIEVTPGQITYLGQIELIYKQNSLKLVNKLDRDLPKLKTMFPDIDWNLIK